MPNVYLIAALAFVLGITGAYVKGRSDGGQLVVSEYAQRDLADERVNAAVVKGINARYRAKEQAQAQAFAAVSAGYQKRIANNEAQKRDDAAALDARTLVLRDPSSPRVQSCGGGAASAAPGAGGRDGPAGGELSLPASRFLLALANEADGVVNQLTACQAVVEADRLLAK